MIESVANTRCQLALGKKGYRDRIGMHPSRNLTNRAGNVGLVYLVTLEAFVQVTRYPHGP